MLHCIALKAISAAAEMAAKPRLMSVEEVPEGERGKFMFGLCFSAYTMHRQERLLKELKTGFGSSSNPRSFALSQDEMDFGHETMYVLIDPCSVALAAES